MINRIIEETESFMMRNIPKSRASDEDSTQGYLKHVLGVKKYALELADIYNADKFTLEIAALLHDIGADAENHALESKVIAEKLISNFDIPRGIVNKILSCIENHSMGTKAETLEEQIIQDADGIIFIEDTYKYFYKKQLKYSLEEAKKLTIDKTKGMLGKINTDEGKKIANNYLEKTLNEIEHFS